jgi:L-malate glycosyltransferase
MKICYIGDGASVHNHFMIDWFMRRGHDLLFLTDTPDALIACETVQLVPRYGHRLRHLKAGWKARKIIKQWQPDIVHAHIITGYGYWGAMSGFSPLVMTSWGSDLNVQSQQNALVRLAVKKCLERSALITADAAALCRTARDIVEQDKDIRELQWGVDVEIFDVGIQDVKKKEYTFLSTRRMRDIYNIDSIIQAYSSIYNRYPWSRLVIIGQDVLADSLKDLVKKLGIEGQVFFPGWVERSEMVEWLQTADAFVSVPSSDSTALSLLEAFAASLPVIVSDLAANREWVKNGENGFLVAPGDIQALADAMLELIAHPERGREWGRHNRQIVESRGNRETEMRKLERWYEELLSR